MINQKEMGNNIWENGNYYIGQFKNGLKNGKGIEYYSNGDIQYKGDFVNNEKDGIGHYIFENGKYYIGQWSNNLRIGKGTLYYPNGKIEKEGNLINDVFAGN